MRCQELVGTSRCTNQCVGFRAQKALSQSQSQSVGAGQLRMSDQMQPRSCVLNYYFPPPPTAEEGSSLVGSGRSALHELDDLHVHVHAPVGVQQGSDC